VPSLPQAATAPALCGRLVSSQMSATPSGGVNTGGAQSGGDAALSMYALGGAGLVGAGALTVAARRRREQG
jgi:hypothetical protein